MRTEKSYCRICTAQCGILVDIEGDTVIRVRGDREHPVTQGYTCPKGRALPDMHHHPDRIERPRMKMAGTLGETTWDACLDDLGHKLKRIIDTDGPSAIGIFFGSGTGMDTAGYRMSEALQAAIGTPAKFSPLTIDGTAKPLVASLMGGFPGFAVRPDYERADLLIFIGVNPVISHGHAMSVPAPARTIRDRAKHGEVWVIDPRRTESANFANRHIAPHPGTDYAILGFLIRSLLADDTAPENLTQTLHGIEDLREAVAPYTLGHAAEVSGVPGADLSDLLQSVRKAGRLGIDTGTGVTMTPSANVTQWFSWALLILTGSMNQPRGMWFHPGFTGPLDMAELPIISAPFGPGPKSHPEWQSFLGDWPCAALVDEINEGHIKAVINLGGAMVRSFPDTNALIPALKKLDVFATLEIIENETTALSTHILPTKDQLERPDVTIWDTLSCRVDAQYTPAMVPPVGDRRSTWWVLSQLITRLGKEPPFPLPESEDAADADDRVLASVTPYARMPFAEIVAHRHVEQPLELPAPWVEAHVERFGGWQMAPGLLVGQHAALREDAAKSAEHGELRLIPRRQKRHLNASFVFLGDTPDILLHPDDAARAGIQDGAPVCVGTNRGEITGIACVSDAIRQGVVSVPHGHEDANVNRLTSANAVDAVTGMVTYSGFPVSIRPGTPQ